MPRRRLLILCGLALFGSPACRHSTEFRNFEPGEPIRPDEVILIGNIRFEPELPAPNSIPHIGPDIWGKLGIAFSYSADDEASMGSLVDFGSKFFIVAPRRPLFLRWVRIYTGATGVHYNKPGVPGGVVYHWLMCHTAKWIPIQPADEAVYLGTILCQHDGEEGQNVLVIDDAASLGAHPKIHGIPVVPRVPSGG